MVSWTSDSLQKRAVRMWWVETVFDIFVGKVDIWGGRDGEQRWKVDVWFEKEIASQSTVGFGGFLKCFLAKTLQ